jgi:hypothetical protein
MSSNVVKEGDIDLSPSKKNDFKKKKVRTQLPTVRFELSMKKPSSDAFTEYNYNKLMLKALKTLKKKSKKKRKLEKRQKRDEEMEKKDELNESDNKSKESKQDLENVKTFDKLEPNDLKILSSEFEVERDRIRELVSNFREKIILAKEFDLGNLDDDAAAANNEDGEDDDEDDDECDECDENDEEDINEEDSNAIAENELKNKKKLKRYQNDNQNKSIALKDFNYLGQVKPKLSYNSIIYLFIIFIFI